MPKKRRAGPGWLAPSATNQPSRTLETKLCIMIMTDTLTLTEKRAIVCEINDLRNNNRGMTLEEACRHVSRSVGEVKLWRKEVDAADDAQAIQRAVRLYRQGWFLRKAAQHGPCTERDLRAALRILPRRRTAATHLSLHSVGHRTTAF